jgi:alpha-tubulin suppressor-like RCC1 family protein
MVGKWQVLTAAGKYHTLLVNEKGELYACGKVLGGPSVPNLQTPMLISVPATVGRIVQISASFNHAAFVTDIGKVIKFFLRSRLRNFGSRMC